MSKKFIPVLIILVLGGLFMTYGVMGNGDKRDNDPNAKYQMILRNVGIVLEQGHYNPQKIDDKFSQEVMKRYLTNLDPDKYIFLEKDIASFKKIENRIDDEIHGAPIESFYTVSSTYKQRIDEIDSIYKLVLSKDFDFSMNEMLETDGDKRKYPINAEQRYDYSRKRLKYLVLSRFVDMQQERDGAKKDSAYKADSTLKREAVAVVSRQMNRYFQTLKTHNTQDEMFSTFVNSITSTMDPHTTYFAPIDKRTFDESLSGTFFGIGAQLKDDNGKVKIVSLITGMPAWKSGQIEPEDQIIKIAEGEALPVDITGYALPDAVKLIRGEKQGSEVRLTLKKADGTIKVVTLKRDKISLEDTYAKSAIINGTHKIGYVFLPEFYADFNDPNARRSSTDVAIEIQKLKDAHVDGIVIDLRGNPGGSLQDVVDMVGLFVKDGPVVQVKGRDEKASVLDTKNKGVLYDGPLAVMVDELSASASEIFAAAIQDYKRGIIVGSSSTYGKGTVQRSISLDPQAENSMFRRATEGLGDIKLTFRKYYRIDGTTTQLNGVVPDIIIPDRLENVKFREKDNPTALSADLIPKAQYSKWNSGYSFSSIIGDMTSKINSNPNFIGIKSTVDLLEKYRDKEVPLNIAKYKEMQAGIKTVSKKLETYMTISKKLDVTTLSVDLNEMGNDSSKIAKQKDFLKVIGQDIYVDETVKVLNDMIGQAVLVKRENLPL
ncbi:MAG: carboxy terminal-processing peptidase [Ginsengibacter sp.]